MEEYDHLKNLDLAEIVDYTDSMEVDILVGLDFYFSFVFGKHKVRKKKQVDKPRRIP